ncbi:unnamed protein product [Arabidopsis halleri]
MDNEDEYPHGGDGGQTSADTSQSKSLVSVSHSVKRSRTSDVWNHFTLEEDENNDKRAYCKKCPKQYLMLPTTGTSNLIRHHGKCSMGVDVERKRVKIDHKVAREKFSRVIIRHDLPFLCVEYEELRDFISYMNPDYRCYTRNTAASDVVKTWEKEKQILKSELERIPSRICLTSDCWTSLGGDGYIVLTAHYVDTKWILNSKILSFCDMLPPHSGDALAGRIHECLKEWGIEKKVFTLTLDRAVATQ